MIEQFLSQLGYSESESKAYITIVQYGPKPVSTIASLSHIDRTYAYRIIDRLTKDGLIEEIIIKGAKQYIHSDYSIFDQLLEKQQQRISKLQESAIQAKSILSELNQSKSVSTPDLKIFQWAEGLKRMVEDMQKIIIHEELLSMGSLISQTFFSQSERLNEESNTMYTFYNFLKSTSRTIQGKLGSGVMIIDNIQTNLSLDDLLSNVIWKGSMHIYIIWRYSYIIQFKEQTLGLKIENQDMSDMLSVIVR